MHNPKNMKEEYKMNFKRQKLSPFFDTFHPKINLFSPENYSERIINFN